MSNPIETSAAANSSPASASANVRSQRRRLTPAMATRRRPPSAAPARNATRDVDERETESPGTPGARGPVTSPAGPRHPNRFARPEGGPGRREAPQEPAATRPPHRCPREDRDRRSNHEEADRTDDDARRPRDAPTRDHEGEDWHRSSDREQDERGDRRFPRRAAEPFRVDAQLLAGQRIDGGRPIGEEVPDHHLRLARTQPLGLIDQLQLLALGLGIFGELTRFDPDFALRELA